MRKKANKSLLLIALIVHLAGLKAQMQADSNLYLGQLLEWVVREHPLAKSAQLEPNLASSNLQAARGLFDPVVTWQQFSKDLSGKPYYNGQQWSVQGYTRWAIGYETGFEKMTGDATNPALATPDAGFYYHGLSLPLLRNLSTDYRRTAFQKAQLLNRASIWEKRQQINELLAEVSRDYIAWTQAHMQRIQAEKALELSLNRLQAMRELFSHGACNALDTMEVYAQFAFYSSKFEETSYKETAGRYWISRHLWDGNRPVVLKPEVFPDPNHMGALDPWCEQIRSFTDSDSSWIDQTPAYHLAQYKINSKQLEANLWSNQRLPDVNLKYQWLQSEWPKLPTTLYDDQNQRFGIYVQSPLFIREAQGKMEMAQVEQDQLVWAWLQQRRDLLAKQQALWEGVQRNKKAFDWQFDQAQTLGVLYEGELEKFKAGDVQFFVLNTRESRYIQVSLQQWDAWAQMRQTQVDYLFHTGLFHSLPQP
ncbi:MAG: hypothetical protein RL577_128 [Bacteroidota bacterium]